MLVWVEKYWLEFVFGIIITLLTRQYAKQKQRYDTIQKMIEERDQWKSTMDELIALTEKLQKTQTAILVELSAVKTLDYQTAIDGLRSVLHDRIVQKCNFLLNKKERITMNDIEELEELTGPYYTMHGNGSAKAGHQAVIEKYKRQP